MFAVIYIPDFALQAVLRVEPELRTGPVVLVDAAQTTPHIIQLTDTARAHGISAGQTPTQAVARCASALVRSRFPSQEKSASDILLQTAYTFSPNIEDTAPGICTLELKGLASVSTPTEIQQWAEKIRGLLASFHLEAKVGVAATPELALIIAAAAPSVSVLPPADSSSLNNFPVAALGPTPQMAAILSGWGIHNAGEFLTLDKDSVARRLGPAALALFDRVSTERPRPLKLAVVSGEFVEVMDFDQEITTTEPLLFILRRFVDQLSRRFEMIHQVVAEFQLLLRLASGEKHDRTFKVPSPTGKVDILFRMLHTHLETLRTASPIVSVRLGAVPVSPDLHQFGLFECTLRNPHQFAETLARLAALLGADSVGTPLPVFTNKPDAFSMHPPDFDRNNRSQTTAVSVTAETKEQTGPKLRRFRPPLRAGIELCGENPVLLRSELFTGRIVSSRGPFLSSGDWWDKDRWARQEWDVETADGRVLRIFQSNTGSCVEGVYD